MTTLAEVEAAADALSAEEKRELLLFLAARLRVAGQPLPEPRRFPRRPLLDWIDEDAPDRPAVADGDEGR